MKAMPRCLFDIVRMIKALNTDACFGSISSKLTVKTFEPHERQDSGKVISTLHGYPFEKLIGLFFSEFTMVAINVEPFFAVETAFRVIDFANLRRSNRRRN